MFPNLNDNKHSLFRFSLSSGNPEENQKPIPNPQLNQKIPILDIPDEILEETLNISKIKEGFYIGDRISAISLDVISEFKITHIINCTGAQIINQWESMGVKYLTLNWNETSSQILFDSNDEIVEKILSFIESSGKEGEGLLVHSYKGKNRVCVIPLIYLMKKYKWSLNKSMQYLKSKKSDINISPNFIFQLEKYQQRLKQRGELSRDIPWEFENLIDEEEKLMRNTYMNGLSPSKLVNINNQKLILDLFNGATCKIKKKRHINWIDKEPINSSSLEIENMSEDLIFKKNIQPIVCHQRMKPKKPCIVKTEINSKKNNYLLYTDISRNLNGGNNNNRHHNINHNKNFVKINKKNNINEKLKLNIINNNSNNNSRNNGNNKNLRQKPKIDNKNSAISFKKDKNISFNKSKIPQNTKTKSQKKTNLSTTNTTSNTHITIKDLCSEENNINKNSLYSKNTYNTKNSLVKEKLLFNMISLNSLNPLNIKNYGIIENNNRNNKFLNNSNNTYNSQLTSSNSIYSSSTYSRPIEGSFMYNNLTKSTKNSKINIINDSSLSNLTQNSAIKKPKLNLMINKKNARSLFLKNKNGPIEIKNNPNIKKDNASDSDYLNMNNSSNIPKINYKCHHLNISSNIINFSFNNAINGNCNKNSLKKYSKIMKRPMTAPRKDKGNDIKNVKNENKIIKNETKIIKKPKRPNSSSGKVQNKNLIDKKNYMRKNSNEFNYKKLNGKENNAGKNVMKYSHSKTFIRAKRKNFHL